MPDLGVDGVGEVERRGAAGEPADVAPGRVDVDLIGVQVDLEHVGVDQLQLVHRLRAVQSLLELHDHARVVLHRNDALGALEQL